MTMQMMCQGIIRSLGSKAPRYLAVRNVSDPQIKAAGMTLKQQAVLAAQIYKGFGRWSSVCSAIVAGRSLRPNRKGTASDEGELPSNAGLEFFKDGRVRILLVVPTEETMNEVHAVI
jgi:hypothetical protein